MSETRDNRGAIWKNDRREKDTHPHFTGHALIQGVEYWVSAWKRDDGAADRAPVLTFSFKTKEARATPSVPDAKPVEVDDEAIPF